MCTAICDGALFGRTLDLEYSFSERAVITPRQFPLSFRYEGVKYNHYAIIGIAHVARDVPLYYDAMNEKGLCIAALNFPVYAKYQRPRRAAHNVASFEVIPWLLSSCASVKEAAELLQMTNITDDNFSDGLRATPLHFMVADKKNCIVVEPREEGVRVHENPLGVMTNSPPFEYQTAYLQNFLSLSSAPPENKLCPSVSLHPYSRGMGGVGLPGDFSSSSRFVRAAFCKSHATAKAAKAAQINRFFRLLDAVSVPEGCVKTEKGEDVLTVYASCADTETLSYHFTTHDDRKIRSISFGEAELDSQKLTSFSMYGQ